MLTKIYEISIPFPPAKVNPFAGILRQKIGRKEPPFKLAKFIILPTGATKNAIHESGMQSRTNKDG